LQRPSIRIRLPVPQRPSRPRLSAPPRSPGHPQRSPLKIPYLSCSACSATSTASVLPRRSSFCLRSSTS
jgi:hypothetical protein